MSVRVVAVVAFCLVLGAITSAQPRFSQQLLENADSSLDDAFASDVNNSNIVVGKYGFSGSDSEKAFVWRNYSPFMTLLPKLSTNGYGNSRAKAIRNGANPTIVGQSRNNSGTYRAVRWTTSDAVNYTAQDLHGSPFSWDGEANGINDSGVIVGWGRVGSSSGVVHAFRWTGGTITDLYAGDARNSRAAAINNGGRIAGYVDISTSNSNNKAIWFSGASRTNLPQNDGSPYDMSEAHGINNNNHIVGRVHDAGGWRACVWYWNGASYNNPIVIAGYNSIAYDINDGGLIVGEVNDRGFIYNGTLYDVNNLPIGGFSGINGGSIRRLTAINDSPTGFVAMAGYGANNSGSTRSVICRAQSGVSDDQGAIGSVSIIGGGIEPLSTATARFDFSYNSNPDGIGQSRRVNLWVSGGDATFSNGGTYQFFDVGRNNSATPNFNVHTGWGSIGQQITITATVDGYECLPGRFTIRRANTRVAPNGGTVRYFEPMNLAANLSLTELGNGPLNGHPLKWSYNGTDIGSNLTNPQGNAVLSNVTTPLFIPPGTQTLLVRFDGSTNYNPSNATVQVTVQKAPTTLNLANNSSMAGQVVRLQAQLLRAYGAVPLQGQSVAFSVSGVGVVGSATTNAAGVAFIDWRIPVGFGIGSRQYTASYAGDNSHASSSQVGSFTVINSPPVAALAGSSLSFDGVGDFVQLPNSIWFDGGPFTIEGWAQVRSHVNYARFFEFGNANYADIVGLVLSFEGTGVPYAQIANGTIYWTGASGAPMPLNSWSHLAASFDGTTLRLYRDGALVSQVASLPPVAVQRTVSYFAYPFVNGVLDEARVWTVARSQQQIDNAKSKWLPADTPGLASYWRFDDGFGGVLTDSTSSMRHGNVIGTWDWRASSAPISSVDVEFETARSFTLGAFDADRDVLTAEIVTPPSFGTLDVSGQSATYVPSCGFVGNDTFSYRVSDGSSTSNTATVTLVVTNTKSAWPTSVSVILGEEFSGNLQSLLCSDDNRFVLLSDSSMLGLVEMGTTLPLTKLLSQVRTETSVARPGLQEVYSLYNWVNPGWNVVNGRTASVVDSVFAVNVTSGSLYTSSTGAVKLRIQWNPLNDEDPAFDGWALSVDSVRFRY